MWQKGPFNDEVNACVDKPVFTKDKPFWYLLPINYFLLALLFLYILSCFCGSNWQFWNAERKPV